MGKIPRFAKKEAHDSTGFLLWQVTSIWQRNIAAALRAHKLTQVQFALLASLLWLSSKEDHISQSRLARHAKLDIMMTSQVLRTLEMRGLIERQTHPTDTRTKILFLTESGRTLAWNAVPDVEKADAIFFSSLNSERAEFNELLRCLI